MANFYRLIQRITAQLNRSCLLVMHRLWRSLHSRDRQREPLPGQPKRPRQTYWGRRSQYGSWLMAILMLLPLGAFSLGSTDSLAPATAATPLQPPLSTRKAEIVDATGRPVLLRGVNWFGLETETHAPHGLWSRDYQEMLAQIKQLGYNVIRLPYSVQALRDPSVSGINFDIGNNRDLRDKTPLEVMDRIIQAAGQQGLLVLLDSHRLNNERIPELWYGDGFTETDWINAWTLLAQRYKNQPNVIGADLKNEPHGRASWGTNDRATDWRLAAERAGNAILKVNPNWLIVVEGVENNVPGQKLKRHWMGGNLEGVWRFPVRLNVPNKLVYSPHEYGPGVSDQPWFSESSFPKNLESRWEKGFYYIAQKQIAPVWIGEFGGRQVDTTSKEGIWQRQLVAFIQRRRLGFAYWSWNANSGDTGGILLDDWQTIDQPKQTLLNQTLPAPTMVAVEPKPLPPTNPPTTGPSPKPTSSSSPKPSPRASAPPPPNQSNPLQAKLIVQSDWQKGFCVSLPVTNQGETSVANWRLKFQMKQATLTQSWNGTPEVTGASYTIVPPDWGRTIQPKQTVDFGFCATKSGPDYMPQQLTAIP